MIGVEQGRYVDDTDELLSKSLLHFMKKCDQNVIIGIT